MILYILRGVFILLVASVATLYLLPYTVPGKGHVGFGQFVTILCVTIGIAAFVIGADVLSPRKKLSAVSGVFLGLLAGMLAAYALSFVVNLVGIYVPPPAGVDAVAFENLLQGVKVLIGLVTCYLGISLVLQTKDDFRFVIPYVEFAKQIRGNRPTLLDTSVIIDGRIVDVVETGVLPGELIVPKFVLEELHMVADSSDKLRRARGRRGLDVLQKMQDSPEADVSIQDVEVAGTEVDERLVTLGGQMQARVMTGDYNLMKIAHLRGVDVININDLARALKPVALPGEEMTVRIVKPGEGTGQGVGYLEDGTMVVVENGRQRVGERIILIVTSTLQTTAGRMIFGRYHDQAPEESSASPEAPTETAAPAPLHEAPPASGTSDQRPDAHAESRQSRPSRRNPRRRG